MAWEKNRPTHVPKNIRGAALERDGHQCTATMHDGSRCTETNNLEADEIRGWIPGKVVTVRDVQMLCHWHHNRKTQAEAARARGPRPTDRRPPDRHPGLS